MRTLRIIKASHHFAPVMLISLIVLSISIYGCGVSSKFRNKRKSVNTSSLISDVFRNGVVVTYPSSRSSGPLTAIATNLAARFGTGRFNAITDSSLSEGDIENSNVSILGDKWKVDPDRFWNFQSQTDTI